MAAPPTEAPPAAETCPSCGTPYRPHQEYCLECGARLPTPGVVTTLATGWRRRLPWYPGDWIWPVLVALLVALVATGVVLGATWGTGGGSTIVATGPATSAPPTTAAPTTTSATTPVTIPEPASPPPAPPPPPPPPSGPVSWPAGKSGFTVVLESIPTSNGQASALAKANAAIRAGLRSVGVLDSSKYPSLHPGYWVVFSGVYASKVDATSAASSAKASGYSDAYPAAVTP